MARHRCRINRHLDPPAGGPGPPLTPGLRPLISACLCHMGSDLQQTRTMCTYWRRFSTADPLLLRKQGVFRVTLTFTLLTCVWWCGRSSSEWQSSNGAVNIARKDLDFGRGEISLFKTTSRLQGPTQPHTASNSFILQRVVSHIPTDKVMPTNRLLLDFRQSQLELNASPHALWPSTAGGKGPQHHK
jgi:hypothetical protein